jgi:glucose-1-phosphate adenylyltransferase
MLAEHLARNADLSIAALRVPIESASAFGIVTTADDDRITASSRSRRRPPPCADDPSVAFASMGIYCFETGIPVRSAAQRREVSGLVA